jgi:hypothetical protein
MFCIRIRSLGFTDVYSPQEQYMPAAAYSGGPVADENKPMEELFELL